MFMNNVLFVVAVALIVSMNAVLITASYKLIQKVCMKALETIDRISEEP